MALRLVHFNAEMAGQACTSGVSPAAKSDTDSAKLGYNKALIKHADLIAEIQKYFPGWQPEFRYPY
ncbi:MAG: hypothetical protein JST50_01425 [Bacteroidetes bacterium]|nr:hypothetical protein [Bacteroidota bacterium]